jgi:hypothetical protein
MSSVAMISGIKMLTGEVGGEFMDTQEACCYDLVVVRRIKNRGLDW